jgi:hypothetical protein
MSFEPSRVLNKLGSTQAQARLLNFLICQPSGIQTRVCEQPLYIYLYGIYVGARTQILPKTVLWRPATSVSSGEDKYRRRGLSAIVNRSWVGWFGSPDSGGD